MTEEYRDQITAVIPAFNEEKTISSVVEKTKHYASQVIVIDDGSWDSTSIKAISAGASIIKLPKNSGKGNALAIGLTTAAMNGGKVVVCLDGDGQHNPDDIPKIIEPIISDRADMVIGSRFLNVDSKNEIPAYRRFGQGMLTIATNLGNSVKITDSQSGYRAFKKDILNSFSYAETGMGIESEMARSAVHQGFRIEEVSIKAQYEGLDTSTFAPGNHGMSVLASILREIRSEHPMLYFGVSGFLMTLMGVILGIYCIQRYIDTKALPFGPTLMAVMLAALGILFVLVGLILSAIGEMVNGSRGRKSNSR